MPRELALRMARLAHMIRDLIIAAFGKDEEGLLSTPTHGFP